MTSLLAAHTSQLSSFSRAAHPLASEIYQAIRLTGASRALGNSRRTKDAVGRSYGICLSKLRCEYKVAASFSSVRERLLEGLEPRRAESARPEPAEQGRAERTGTLLILLPSHSFFPSLSFYFQFTAPRMWVDPPYLDANMHAAQRPGEPHRPHSMGLVTPHRALRGGSNLVANMFHTNWRKSRKIYNFTPTPPNPTQPLRNI